MRAADRLKEARDALRRAVEIEPSPDRYSNLGLVVRDMGDYGEASKLFQKSIDLNPRDYRAWGFLADMYRRSGRNAAKTRETYRKSIELAEEPRGTVAQDERV